MIWADSCGKSASRRLQAKAVPAESVHKKTANKVVDFVDSLGLIRFFKNGLVLYFKNGDLCPSLIMLFDF
ncbi:hypothetical protein BU101_09815 [Staphylococcus shinii]|nr:hypothetical protein BU101_09815 [Staphylococcus shinii]